jgi:hypothetical protein
MVLVSICWYFGGKFKTGISLCEKCQILSFAKFKIYRKFIFPFPELKIGNFELHSAKIHKFLQKINFSGIWCIINSSPRYIINFLIFNFKFFAISDLTLFKKMQSVCSHMMVLAYWAEAVKSDRKIAFKSRKCESWKHYIRNDCDKSSPAGYIGLYTSNDLVGNYYVKTNKFPPYSKT